MSKYGLQLRIPPQQKKQAKRAIPAPVSFNDDGDDDDNVEREIMRQAHKNKTLKDIEEQQQKALEEDPSVFDYDGVYDKMKEKQLRPLEQDRQERKPRYIQALVEKAKQREKEHEVIYERKLAKERSIDEHLYTDKEKFVTGAYKRKLAEQEKWLQEERLRQMIEGREDVTKKKDITDFYFNLAKNEAFGAREDENKKHAEEPAARLPEEVSAPATVATSESSGIVKSPQIISSGYPFPKENPDRPYTKPTSSIPATDQVMDEPLATNQPKPNDQKQNEHAAAAPNEHHRRNEDAVAAARDRFLSRKKAKH